MADYPSIPPWTQSGWSEQASAWIHAQLDQLGIGVSGPIEETQVRPWSIVLHMHISEGRVYFKASAAMLLHEAAVTQALSHWQPDCLPAILAVDVQRGWMLMRDGGPRLREIIKADRNLQHWEKLLPRYATLQIESAERIPDLLALGTPDWRLATLPDHYGVILANTAVLRIGLPEGLSAEEHRRLHDLKPQVAALCERLSASDVPESIHHGDFHDGNIFLSEGRYLITDWGDCSISHPFFSLRTAYVSNENSLGLEEDAPVLDRLRDAYLETWAKFGTREQLLGIFELARRLSPISSALGWYHVISNLEESLREDYAGAIPSLLQEFLSLNTQASE
jgi:hypothetical protein